jgi:hypothetical protein
MMLSLLQSLGVGDRGLARWSGRATETRPADSGLNLLPRERSAPSLAEFEPTGFRGGLNWYRNSDRNWELTAPWTGARVMAPALYVGVSAQMKLSPW